MDKNEDRKANSSSSALGADDGGVADDLGLPQADVLALIASNSGQRPDGTFFPATLSQTHIWKHCRIHGANPCLNVAAQWRLTGKLNVPLIGKAWQAIVDRHEALRTRLVERNGKVLQQVVPLVRFKISHVDLRATSEELKSSLADRLSEEEASKPFDVEVAPLFRITILQSSNDEARMLLTTHHAVSDCWANLTLVREFGSVYEQLSSSQKCELPEVALQFGDFALWQEAWFAAGGADDADRYWTSKLAALPKFQVPLDRAPSLATQRGSIVGLAVPDKVIRTAVAAAQTQGTTLFAFGLATFASILQRWTACSDIVVTTQIAGRDELELETVVGPFINTIALRFEAKSSDRFSALLRNTVVTVSEALENRAMPFERILDSVDIQVTDRRGPLMGVNFQVLNNAFLRDNQVGTLRFRGIPSVSPGAKRDLDLYLVERDGAWRAQCEYDPDLFEAATIENLVKSFIGALAFVADNLDFELWSVPTLLPVPERHEPIRSETSGQSTPAAELPGNDVPAELLKQFGTAGEVEAQLIEIWKELLRNEAITTDSNFFECGGHSLSAIQLMRRIESVWGIKLPVTRLFKSPTIRELAALVPRKQLPLLDWQVVPIQSTGSRTPIIALNNTMVYYNLSRKLGPERPFFCVQAFDPENPEELPVRSFEQIATDYVRLIRQALPRGPYILLGHCVAGALAFEVAQRLRQDGDRIPLVVMADTWLPGYRRRLPPIQRALANWAYRLHVARHKIISIWKGKFAIVEVLSEYRIARRLGILNFAGARRFAQEDWANRWFLPNLEAARESYRATRSGEAIVVYCSDEITTSFASTKLGWDTIGETWTHICKVPGWHTDIFGPAGLDILAEDLALRLEEADRNLGYPVLQNR